MAQDRRRPTKLSEITRSVFISGRRRGKSEESVWNRSTSAIWELHSNLLDLQPSAQPDSYISVVVNDCSPPRENWPVGTLEHISEKVWNMPRGDGITLIFFAHRYGANVLYDVLKEDNLKKFLRRKGVREGDLYQKVEDIRRHMAIITLGGLQDIPVNFAEVCLNVIIRGDIIGRFFGKVLQHEHGESVSELIVANEKGGGLVDIVRSLTSSNLRDYTENKELRDKLWKAFNDTQQTGL